MKNLFKIFLIALSLCVLFVFVSCSDDGEQTPTESSSDIEQTSTDITEETSTEEEESSTKEEESSRFVEGAGRNEQLGDGWSPFYPSDFNQ